MSKKRRFFNDGYVNSQKYLECQLVTIINAAIHLGEEPVSPDSEEYERLVDIVLARHGCAIRPEYAFDYLRIECFNTDPGWDTLKMHLANGFPVEYGINHPGVGFHSVLVVACVDTDRRPKRRVRVANLPQATDKNMWMDWDDFQKSWYFLSNWEARYFRLKKERECGLLQKKMQILGYPSEWFHRKHKKFGDRSPFELIMSGREGIDAVKEEVAKRKKWTDEKRRGEIQKLERRKIVRGEQGDGNFDMDDAIAALVGIQAMDKLKERFIELADEVGIMEKLKSEIAEKRG